MVMIFLEKKKKKIDVFFKCRFFIIKNVIFMTITVLLFSSCITRGSPVVWAAEAMASMTRCKLWKTGEDGLCCSSSAIQTRPGPSSLLEERSKTPIAFVVSFVLSDNPPNWGKRPRYIGR